MTASKLLLRIAIVAYVVSLAMPTVQDGPGLIFAVWGFVAFAMAKSWFLVWLANPFFVASAWMIHSGRHSALRRVLAVGGAVFATFALLFDAHPGGHDSVALQVGYWIWLAAVVLMAASAVLSPMHDERPAETATAVAGEAA